jgi:hypothetical protein
VGGCVGGCVGECVWKGVWEKVCVEGCVVGCVGWCVGGCVGGVWGGGGIGMCRSQRPRVSPPPFATAPVAAPLAPPRPASQRCGWTILVKNGGVIQPYPIPHAPTGTCVQVQPHASAPSLSWSKTTSARHHLPPEHIYLPRPHPRAATPPRAASAGTVDYRRHEMDEIPCVPGQDTLCKGRAASSTLCSDPVRAARGWHRLLRPKRNFVVQRIRVVVQIISRICSGEQPEFVTRWNNCFRLPICHGAEFATHVVYQREWFLCTETSGSVSICWSHEALQCADHRNRERRRPPRKLAVLASSAANCFVTFIQLRGVVGHTAQAD